MISSIKYSALLFGLANIANAKPVEERVLEIPGYPKFDFGMYSGYTPINGTTKNIHYLLIES